MEINLRKARKLQSSLSNYLKEELLLDNKASIRSMGTLDQALESVLSKHTEFFNNLELRNQILQLIYRVRREIEIKNEESGINQLINSKVINQKILEEFQNIDKNETPSNEELSDMLVASSKILNSGNDSDSILRRSLGSVKTSFIISCLNKKDIDFISSEKARIARVQQSIDESLNYLNITTNITLTEEDTKILEMCKLL